MNQQILVASEVAELLRVDKQRVYELVRTHQLPVIRIGERQYRFSLREIQEWIDRGGSERGGEAERNGK